MTDEYGAVETADETVTVTEPAAEGDATSSRRGRPRDQSVIERDQRVLEALQPGESKTKSQIAADLGLEPNTVYLSLWRLHKNGQVEREQRNWKRA
jgi:predicted Rossmann fold nucleotide-binding protein DprA/Smf involved in DNA uptake